MLQILSYLLAFVLSFSTAYTNLPVPTPTIKPTSVPKPTGSTPGNLVVTPKGTFSTTILTFDMSRTKMLTDSASDGDCGNNCPVLSLAEYVSKNGGTAGINGTYFCPVAYLECSSKTNSFDFPIFVSRLNHWVNNYALSWSERRAVVYQDGSGVHYQHNSAGFGGGVTAAVINYPGLVDGGNVQIDDNQSGLSAKQQAKNTKLSLCVVNSQKLLAIIAKNVTMLEFAYVNQALGCQGALNMDTGGSLAMISGGRYLYGPGRALPNAIIFANK